MTTHLCLHLTRTVRPPRTTSSTYVPRGAIVAAAARGNFDSIPPEVAGSWLQHDEYEGVEGEDASPSLAELSRSLRERRQRQRPEKRQQWGPPQDMQQPTPRAEPNQSPMTISSPTALSPTPSAEPSQASPAATGGTQGPVPATGVVAPWQSSPELHPPGTGERRPSRAGAAGGLVGSQGAAGVTGGLPGTGSRGDAASAPAYGFGQDLDYSPFKKPAPVRSLTAAPASTSKPALSSSAAGGGASSRTNSGRPANNLSPGDRAAAAKATGKVSTARTGRLAPTLAQQPSSSLPHLGDAQEALRAGTSRSDGGGGTVSGRGRGSSTDLVVPEPPAAALHPQVTFRNVAELRKVLQARRDSATEAPPPRSVGTSPEGYSSGNSSRCISPAAAGSANHHDITNSTGSPNSSSTTSSSSSSSSSSSVNNDRSTLSSAAAAGAIDAASGPAQPASYPHAPGPTSSLPPRRFPMPPHLRGPAAPAAMQPPASTSGRGSEPEEAAVRSASRGMAHALVQPRSTDTLSGSGRAPGPRMGLRPFSGPSLADWGAAENAGADERQGRGALQGMGRATSPSGARSQSTGPVSRSSGYAELEGDKDYQKAQKYALSRLQREPMSCADLARRLVERGHRREVVDALVEYLMEAEALNDALYARLYVQSKWRSRLTAPAKIHKDLLALGVSERDVTSALEGVFGPTHRIRLVGAQCQEERDVREALLDAARRHVEQGQGQGRTELSAREGSARDDTRRTAGISKWGRVGDDSDGDMAGAAAAAKERDRKRRRLATWLQYRGHDVDMVMKVISALKL